MGINFFREVSFEPENSLKAVELLETVKANLSQKLSGQEMDEWTLYMFDYISQYVELRNKFKHMTDKADDEFIQILCEDIVTKNKARQSKSETQQNKNDSD